jgi:hypothetical protein
MRKSANLLWIALVAGFSISALLFYLAYATHISALGPPQLVGFYVCVLLRGIHSATKADYALIALPVNAAIYATVIFILLRVIWWAKSD